jgi:hypothetical protein
MSSTEREISTSISQAIKACSRNLLYRSKTSQKLTVGFTT